MTKKKMTENFLALFSNITLYTQDQEILLSKKVKKCFLGKKDQIYQKLEPFKEINRRTANKNKR